MKKFSENLTSLLKVKTLVTTAVMAVFCLLAVRGDIDAESVIINFSDVLTNIVQDAERR